MGNLALFYKLYKWWNGFIAILKGEVSLLTPQSPMDPLAVQYYLNRKGYWCLMDGVWGEATQKVLRKFQVDNGLDPDGAVGKLTWQKLSEGV
jgi:peptidoglycan hydrolase-like protein with peptidoglycan-binding domain